MVRDIVLDYVIKISNNKNRVSNICSLFKDVYFIANDPRLFNIAINTCLISLNII